MFEKLKAILSKKQEPSKPENKANTRPPFERLCGYGAMLERMKQESLLNPNNQVKPTFRKPKPLFYKGERIITYQRQSDGKNFTLTLESDKNMRLSNKEWYMDIEEIY